MKIQTFSIVVGTRSCNAHCKFCVSHMTGFEQIPNVREWDEQSLKKAIKLAQIGGCTTVLLTGKGEPTLYPGQITGYLRSLGENFPLIELQTNAIDIGKLAQAWDDGKLADTSTKIRGVSLTKSDLEVWRSLGLDTIAISTVGINSEHNKETYLWHKDEQYPDLSRTIRFLHGMRFSVRLCVMMRKGAVDSFEKVEEVVSYAKKLGVAQLTCRPIVSTDKSTDEEEVNHYVEMNGLNSQVASDIYWQVANSEKTTQLMSLMHGGTVYDFDGQNLCMANCLTNEGNNSREIRTLIYYPTGEISYDWQYKGAVLKGRTRRY